MKVQFSASFTKKFNKRFLHNSTLKKKLRQRAELFQKNSTSPILKDHPLIGKKKGYRAFSVTGDIRVIYYVKDDIAYFMDIGTHNQVY